MKTKKHNGEIKGLNYQPTLVENVYKFVKFERPEGGGLMVEMVRTLRYSQHC